MSEPPQFVAVKAKDWALYKEQISADYEFPLVEGWIAGFLVCEDDERVVIAHQWFPEDDQVRNTSAIPKSNIIDRKPLYPLAANG